MTTSCTIKGLELVRSTESGSFTLKIDAMVLQAAAPPAPIKPPTGKGLSGTVALTGSSHKS